MDICVAEVSSHPSRFSPPGELPAGLGLQDREWCALGLLGTRRLPTNLKHQVTIWTPRILLPSRTQCADVGGTSWARLMSKYASELYVPC